MKHRLAVLIAKQFNAFVYVWHEGSRSDVHSFWTEGADRTLTNAAATEFEDAEHLFSTMLRVCPAKCFIAHRDTVAELVAKYGWDRASSLDTAA